MSNNGDKPKLQITCPKCQQVFSGELPTLEIANNLRTSVVTAAHPKLIYCHNNKCRMPFIPIIVQVQAAWQAAPANDEAVKEIEGSSIIRPTLGLVQ